jgi:hypothetical protein
LLYVSFNSTKLYIGRLQTILYLGTVYNKVQ